MSQDYKMLTFFKQEFDLLNNYNNTITVFLSCAFFILPALLEHILDKKIKLFDPTLYLFFVVMLYGACMASLGKRKLISRIRAQTTAVNLNSDKLQ